MKRSLRFWPAATCAIVLAGLVLAPPAAQASTTATSASGSALAVTPPMGYNNWASTGCSTNNPNAGDVGPSETLILNQAASLVSSGLAAKGYQTVTIDDCWMTHSRGADGNLVVDSAKFPNGMAYIGQQLHDKGLKFGIYEDIGNWTCGGFPGDYGQFQQDADLFASWGVDYVKLDGCNMPSADNNLAGYAKDYAAFAAALKNNASHRDMVFSNSAPAYFSIGPSDLGNWYSIVDASSSASQLWRSGYDVKMAHAGGSAWTKTGNQAGVLTQYGYNTELARYSGPGNWNDPDFLIPDQLTDAETRSQIALYSVTSSPLILSTDVTNLSAAALSALNNSDVIAVDQDALGAGAVRMSDGPANSSSGTELVAKPLSDGSLAAVVLNKGSATQAGYSLSLSALGLDTATSGCTYTVKDLWGNQGWSSNTSTASTGSVALTNIAGHDNAMLKITPNSSCAAHTPTGQISSSPRGISSAPLCQERYGSTTEVDIATCTGATKQQWQMKADGTVRLVEPGAGGTAQCLTAPSATTTSAVNGQSGMWLRVDTCGAAADAGYQNWTYGRDGNLVLAGSTANAGRCADVYGAATGTSGTPVDLTACAAAPDALKAAQVWAAPVGATTYQADRAGTLGGQAQVSSCGTCPDGKLVGFIGGTTNSGTLTFANVKVATSGTYQLQIDYINGDAGARTGNITVNGGTATPVGFPTNGNWTTVGSKLVTVGLKAGTNTVRFSNPNGWAASIASLSVPTVPTGRLYYADTAGTLGGGAQVAACSTCLDGKLVGFIGGTTNTGTLTLNVTAETAGTYQLQIAYINGDPTARTGNITVNGGTATPVSFPTNGSWTVLQNKTVTVTLQAGNNTVKFGNPNGWAASISTVTL
ncbi:ricin-type beta-trefoil lectin domain protein [Kitasatospora sp. NBC_00240]|uniref:CBM35 domain-containing protein n=1 Tax=Kitasatospora sp. NBC_00240 TaxID=2903567 RepID=UPI00224F617E|nr:CBM35 domain-containing protein [Kitasatospora sp. NBC_00240]MCX5208324.1 ricin-type beta-trefoil lectin domain protein [Kitasatospora sp. NBC_00240]